MRLRPVCATVDETIQEKYVGNLAKTQFQRRRHAIDKGIELPLQWHIHAFDRIDSRSAVSQYRDVRNRIDKSYKRCRFQLRVDQRTQLDSAKSISRMVFGWIGKPW